MHTCSCGSLRRLSTKRRRFSSAGRPELAGAAGAAGVAAGVADEVEGEVAGSGGLLQIPRTRRTRRRNTFHRFVH